MTKIMSMIGIIGVVCLLGVLVGSGKPAYQATLERQPKDATPIRIEITNMGFFGILTPVSITPRQFSQNIKTSSEKDTRIIRDRKTINKYMVLVNKLSGEPKYKDIDTRARLLLFYKNGLTDTLYMDSGVVLKDGQYYLNDSNLIKLVAVGKTSVSMHDLIMGLEYKRQQRK